MVYPTTSGWVTPFSISLRNSVKNGAFALFSPPCVLHRKQNVKIRSPQSKWNEVWWQLSGSFRGNQRVRGDLGKGVFFLLKFHIGLPRLLYHLGILFSSESLCSYSETRNILSWNSYLMSFYTHVIYKLIKNNLSQLNKYFTQTRIHIYAIEFWAFRYRSSFSSLSIMNGPVFFTILPQMVSIH